MPIKLSILIRNKYKPNASTWNGKRPPVEECAVKYGLRCSANSTICFLGGVLC